MKLSLLKRICLLSLSLVLALSLAGCLQEDPAGEDGLLSLEQLEETLPEAAEDTGPVLPEQFSLPYAAGQTLDPITCGDGMQQVVASLIFEGLFRLGPDFEPQPCLCESFTREGNRYVLTLRQDAAFSDGSPLTAKDVKATLDRAKTSARYEQRLSSVSRIAANKNGTVTITLSAPNAALPALLDIPIVKSGSEKRQPLGTGPYLYEQEDRCLAANRSWWQGGGQPADRIALVEASDQDTVLYRFSSHDVQLITADLTGSASVSTTGSVTCLDADTTVFQYLGCNTARSPLDDPALRIRLWRSMDRGRLVSTLFSGHGAAAQFPISPASPLYPNALEFSDAAAIEGGADLEEPLVLLVNEENRFKVSMARQIAADFTDVGIPTEIRVLPWEEYLEALEKGDFDLYYGETRLTADWNLTPLLGTGGTLNYSGWSDPQMDQLLADFAAAEDRAGAAERLCARLRSQAPILPVCFKAVSTLIQPGTAESLISTAAEPFYNLTDCIIRIRGEGG